MPKLYEYLGIIIFFWSKEHEPIHVHGEYQGKMSRAEIHIEEGRVKEIIITKVPGRKPLDPRQMRLFESFVEQHAQDIVQKWIDYFVLHKKIPCERITKKEQ